MENARVLAKIKIVPIFAPAFAKIVKWYNSGFVNRNSGFDSRSWLTKTLTGRDNFPAGFFIVRYNAPLFSLKYFKIRVKTF